MSNCTVPTYKMKFCLVLSAILATAFAVVPYEEILSQEFQLFKTQFKKSYDNPAENLRRMEVYLQTKYEVEKHNLRYRNGEETYEMEVNEFADWYPEEIEAMNGFNRDLRDRAQAGEDVVFPEPEGILYEAPNTAAPAYVNWAEKGILGRVQYQGSCGSGYAFSAIGALEAQYHLQTRNETLLSKQQIIDCSQGYGNKGCHGGNSVNTYEYIRESVSGLSSARDYPYEGGIFECRAKPQITAITCTGYYRVPRNEEDLKHAVASCGPISVAINVNYNFLNYKGGVFSDSKCKSDMKSLNHAVIIAGYGVDAMTNEPYWLIKNSWGTAWGEKGYMRLARNKRNMCGIATYATYPLTF